MKKYFLLVFVLTLLVLSNTASAETTFVPRYINLVNKNIVTPTFNAGDKVDLDITLEGIRTPADKTSVEYGVVRQIRDSNTTRYEPISIGLTEKSYTVGSKNLVVSVQIPNVLNVAGTSTYVFYSRIYVTGDQDKENFVTSKQNFRIKGNPAEPLTKLKYANILMSNGVQYPLTSGPTIYDLKKTTYKGVASSTSLEITFESNVDIILTPNIVFSKLRSDVSVPDFKAENIKINKGENRIIIPLPNFNYETGVYQGLLKLGNKGIPDLSFQYIVGGDMVTFGQPVYTKSTKDQTLQFNVYGTPIDFNLNPILNNFSTSTMEQMFSTSSRVYGTDFIVKDTNEKELYRTTEDVDFGTSTYSFVLPNNISGDIQIYIKTTSNRGKILYEGTKELNVPAPAEDFFSKNLILISVAVLLLFLIILFFILKHKHQKVVVATLALTVLFFGVRSVKAEEWVVPDTMKTIASYSSDSAYYESLTWNHAGYLVKFGAYIPDEPYYTDEDLLVKYKSVYEFCNNSMDTFNSIIYLYSSAGTMKSSGGSHNLSYGSYWDGSAEAAYSPQKHNHIIFSPWIEVNLGKPAVGDGIYVNYTISGGKAAFNQWYIPLKIKNVTEVQTAQIDQATSTEISNTTPTAGVNIKTCHVSPISSSVNTLTTFTIDNPDENSSYQWVTKVDSSNFNSKTNNTQSSYLITPSATGLYKTSVLITNNSTTTRLICPTVTVDCGVYPNSSCSESGNQKVFTCSSLGSWVESGSTQCAIKAFCDPLDGIIVPSGTNRTFWSSRISSSCQGSEARCIDGNLKQANATSTDFASSTYKYRTCVTPSAGEF